MPAAIALLDDADLKVCLAAHQVLEGAAAMRRRLREIIRQPRGIVPEPGVLDGPPPEKRPAEDAKLLDGILAAVPALKRSLGNEKEVRVRLAALYVLETLDDSAEKAVDEVTKVLNDKNGFVRWGAVRVLNNMAPRQAEIAVPALAGTLTDGNKTVRLAATQALRRYGPQASAAMRPLMMTIGDSEPQVRIAVINALAAIGPSAHPSVSAVVPALMDEQPAVREAAAQALGQLGPLNAEAKKALSKALEDSEASVRQAASETLLGKD